MRAIIFSILFSLSTSISACPELSEISDYLANGNIEGIEGALACGFDIHREGDKALYIAIKNQQKEMEVFLRAKGLKDNAKYVQNFWLSNLNSAKSLKIYAQRYRLNNYKSLNVESWREELSRYLEKLGEDKKKLFDSWGHPFIYTKTNKSDKITMAFCSLGKDGKVGGELYNRDICSSDDYERIKKDLKRIGYF